MGADPRLLNHPAIRREAERLAREMVGDMNSAEAAMACGVAASHFRRLLSDPSRPETRDALVRMGQAATGPALGPLDSTPNWHALRDDPNALVREFLAVVPNE